MKFSTSITLFAFILSTSLAMAETRYVTDEFKVTLRTGTSTSNSILTMLKSGEAVTLIELDGATKYAYVETQNGKKGYILSRFLDEQPSGRALYQALSIKSQQQKESISALKSQLNEMQQDNNKLETRVEELNNQLDTTVDELSELSASTKDTVKILALNKQQKALIQSLKDEKTALQEENNSYKDSTAMNWFVRGAGVTLIAFLMGIIVTRIRWKKRDSWGDY